MEQLNYEISNILICRTDYIDLFKKDEEYEIVQKEDIFGEDMYYVSHNGKKISGWPLKKFELDIMFKMK